jgi:uncharacterized membrane protein YgaE (UPF0421/DUF939 family)
MTFGPRVLKTGIAVTLSLYLCSLLKLEPRVFAGVAAILAIQPSIYRTWRYLLDQIITNTLGAIIAIVSIRFLGNTPITIGLVMILVISLTLKMKMESSIPLVLITILAIMSAPHNEEILFTLNRFYIILVGVGSALIVNLTILPPKYKKNYLQKVHAIHQNLSLLLRTAISNEMVEKSMQTDSKKLRDDLQRLEEQYQLFDEERGKMAKINPLDVREMVVFKQMLRTFQTGEMVLDSIEEHYFQSNANAVENQLFDDYLERAVKIQEYLLLKHAGKIKENGSEEDLMKESEIFYKQIFEIYSQDMEQKFRLLIIASSIVEYSFHLQRLNQLIEQYQNAVNKR